MQATRRATHSSLSNCLDGYKTSIYRNIWLLSRLKSLWHWLSVNQTHISVLLTHLKSLIFACISQATLWIQLIYKTNRKHLHFDISNRINIAQEVARPLILIYWPRCRRIDAERADNIEILTHNSKYCGETFLQNVPASNHAINRATHDTATVTLSNAQRKKNSWRASKWVHK